MDADDIAVNLARQMAVSSARQMDVSLALQIRMDADGLGWMKMV